MRYLFIDIECANVFNGISKICEFGYVVTDEKFNILKKGDIPMSPGKNEKFDKGIFKRDPSFKFAYSFEYYYSCEELPYFYGKIKEIIESADMVFGHSVSNDVRYLDSAIRRYKLKPLDYRAYDTQKMIEYYSSHHEKFMGLYDAFTKLCGKKELVNIDQHYPQDDAYMSMKVLQAMCKKLDVTIDDLILLCPDCYIDVSSYINQHLIKKVWKDLYHEYESYLELEESKGKRCAISSKIQKSFEQTNRVIEAIKLNQLIPTNSIGKSDFLIVEDENDKERLISQFKYPYLGKIIYVNDLLNNMLVTKGGKND